MSCTGPQHGRPGDRLRKGLEAAEVGGSAEELHLLEDPGAPVQHVRGRPLGMHAEGTGNTAASVAASSRLSWAGDFRRAPGLLPRPEDAFPELGNVQVHLKYPLFGPHQLDEEGEVTLEPLADEASSRPEKEVLGDLLGDGAGAPKAAPSSWSFQASAIDSKSNPKWWGNF